MIAKINAVLVILVIPFLVRMWLEAVLWRIEGGPQMLGFSLMHGGEGLLTIPLVISWLAMYAYWIFVVSVLAVWLFPRARKRMTAITPVLIGGASTFVFVLIAAYLQRELPTPVIYGAAVLLTGLVVTCLTVVVLSFRERKNVAV